MKRIFTAFVLLFSLLSLIAQTTFEVAGIRYKTISTTEVEVTSKSPKYEGDVNIPENTTYSGISYSVTSIGDRAFYGSDGLTSITIPNTVTYIGEHAFDNCNGLTSITIPNSVKEIGNHAFQRCSNLSNINISDSINSIGFGNFFNTKWYNDQPDGVVYIGKILYSYKGSMPNNTTISVLDGTISIGLYAFSYKSGLTSINIPHSVIAIGHGAFIDCNGLTSVNIPNSVITIGNEAFRNCWNLSSITIPNFITSIGKKAFSNTKWYDDKPDGVVYIGKVLYSHKGTMADNTTITVLEGTTSISNSAFNVDEMLSTNIEFGLSSITIPSSVNSIGDQAFYGCKGLTSIIMSNTKTNIGKEVIKGCRNLKRIIGHADLLNSSFDIYQSFNTTQSIDTLIINSGKLDNQGIKFWALSNKTLKYLDLKESQNTELADESFYNFYNLENVQLPINLEKIKYREFAECTMLKTIKIPVNVTEIGKRAFENCRSLKKVEFDVNSQLKTIDNWAFYACHGLNEIVIPNGVTTIGDGAFWGCEYLSELTLPSTIQRINDNGFDGCIELNEIKIEAVYPPVVLAKTFNRVNKNANIYVPDESITMYKNAFGWKEFFNIKGLSTHSQEDRQRDFEIRVIHNKIEISNTEGQYIELYDISGRKVFAKSYAENHETIGLHHKGVYLLRIGDFKKKIIID